MEDERIASFLAVVSKSRDLDQETGTGDRESGINNDMLHAVAFCLLNRFSVFSVLLMFHALSPVRCIVPSLTWCGAFWLCSITQQ
jgi:hypothetical protein